MEDLLIEVENGITTEITRNLTDSKDFGSFIDYVSFTFCLDRLKVDIATNKPFDDTSGLRSYVNDLVGDYLKRGVRLDVEYSCDQKQIGYLSNNF